MRNADIEIEARGEQQAPDAPVVDRQVVAEHLKKGMQFVDLVQRNLLQEETDDAEVSAC